MKTRFFLAIGLFLVAILAIEGCGNKKQQPTESTEKTIDTTDSV